MLTALLRVALKSVAQRMLVLSYGKSILAGHESQSQMWHCKENRRHVSCQVRTAADTFHRATTVQGVPQRTLTETGGWSFCVCLAAAWNNVGNHKLQYLPSFEK